MKSDKIFDAISSSYGKYFITIRDSVRETYIVWGEDMTDDRNDKILLDQTNRVLLFERMSDTLVYIVSPSALLFDSQNMKDWARACLDSQPSSSCTYELDFVLALVRTDQFCWLPASKRENCWELLNLLHLISDYAYQIDDTYLLGLYRSEPISTFSDYVYGNYFWTIPEEELAIRNDQMVWEPHYPQFKQNVIDLVNTFRARCVFYNS